MNGYSGGIHDIFLKDHTHKIAPHPAKRLPHGVPLDSDTGFSPVRSLGLLKRKAFTQSTPDKKGIGYPNALYGVRGLLALLRVGRLPHPLSLLLCHLYASIFDISSYFSCYHPIKWQFGTLRSTTTRKEVSHTTNTMCYWLIKKYFFKSVKTQFIFSELCVVMLFTRVH